MPRVQTHTVEGYSYLEKPTLLGTMSEYVTSQFVWPDALRWKGSVIMPTLPGTLIMTGISCLVCLLHINMKVSISVPISVLSTVSVALGLLLAFRVNTAYDRYWEGRKLIQTVMATIRNLARQVWINIPEANEQDHLEKMRCVKLLLAFFVATKHHLRREYGTKYYDLEVLLPPKWEPASVAKRNKLDSLAKQKPNMKSTVLNINLNSAGARNRKKKNMHIFKRAPAVVMTLADSIKPPENAAYMDADDPTHISNIRRSLIQQEFPDSDITQASTSQIKSVLTGQNLEHTISQEEQQPPRLLDEAVSPPPLSGVPDSPRPSHRLEEEEEEDQSGQEESSHTPLRSHSVEGKLHRFKERFHQQHRKGQRRHLDHSDFTSEEDLPYQGDSDLSLPLEILFRVALFINQAKEAKKIESPLVSAATSSLDTLINSLTAFERIVHTPIPKAYNIHLKQAVVLYIFFLPFALVETVGWLVAPIVALVSFTLFGIEAIGAEIENPFGYDDNDLPLNRYCDELKKEVEYIIYHIPTHSTSILLDGQ